MSVQTTWLTPEHQKDRWKRHRDLENTVSSATNTCCGARSLSPYYGLHNNKQMDANGHTSAPHHEDGINTNTSFGSQGWPSMSCDVITLTLKKKTKKLLESNSPTPNAILHQNEEICHRLWITKRMSFCHSSPSTTEQNCDGCLHGPAWARKHSIETLTSNMFHK